MVFGELHTIVGTSLAGVSDRRRPGRVREALDEAIFVLDRPSLVLSVLLGPG